MAVGFRYRIIILGLVLLCSSCEPTERQSIDSQTKPFWLQQTTQHKSFVLTLYSQDHSKLPIGQFHNWIIEISDTDTKSVYPAVFSISGGMSEHGHGLPTQPQVSEYLGDGKYLLEGMKFNMDGEWQIRIEIITQDLKDTLEFSVNVGY